MAQNHHDEEFMSLMLDGLLPDHQEHEFRMWIQRSEDAQDKWERMQIAHALLSRAPEMSPPYSFASSVMSRVAQYEERRRWYPWLVTLLVMLSLVAAVSVAAPFLFVWQGWYQAVIDWPIVGTLLIGIIQTLAGIGFALSVLAEGVVLWIEILTTDPVNLTVVISALSLASLWIGMREAYRHGMALEPVPVQP